MLEHPVRTPKQLGPILQGIRREKKLTQQAAGANVGLAQNAVSQLEANPGPASLERIFKLLSALELELVVRKRGTLKTKAGW